MSTMLSRGTKSPSRTMTALLLLVSSLLPSLLHGFTAPTVTYYKPAAVRIKALHASSLSPSLDNSNPIRNVFAQGSSNNTVASTLKPIEVPAVSDSTTEVSKVPTYRKLLLFCGTTILIWLSEPLLSLVDTSIVGWTQKNSVVQLASMGPSTTLMDSLLYMTYFLAISTTNFISQGLAEKDYKGLQRTTSHILGVASVLGLLVTGVVFMAGRPMLASMAGQSASGELIHYALRYSQIRALVAPLAVTGMVAQSFCLANLDTITPAIAVVAASLINVVGDLALSKYGVVGAAIATAVASASSSIILLNKVRRQVKKWRKAELEEEAKVHLTTAEHVEEVKESKQTPFLSWPDRKSLFKLLAVSGPLCFNMWAKIASYSALTVRASEFGVVALAAQNIMMRLFFFFGCFADSLSQASQSFLPATLYPKKDKAAFDKIMRRLLFLALGISAFIMQASMGFVSTGGKMLAKDASIIKVMSDNKLFLGLALFLHPLLVLMEGVTIATRDFKSLIATYVVTLGVHFTILKNHVSSYHSIWQAMLLFQSCRLGNYLFWKKINGRRNKASNEAAVA